MKKNVERILAFFLILVLIVSFVGICISIVHFSHEIIVSSLNGETDMKSFFGLISIICIFTFIYMAFQMSKFQEFGKALNRYIQFIDFLESDIRLQQKNRNEEYENDNSFYENKNFSYHEMSIEELKNHLDEAISSEDYETAKTIRDIIKNKRK